MRESPAVRTRAIVLAAGASTRMGSDKASLPWLSGEWLLSWTVRALEEAQLDVLVVVGLHNANTWERALGSRRVVINPRSVEGKWTSLMAGFSAAGPGTSDLLITAVDQPRPVSVYQALLSGRRATGAPLVATDNCGRPGHPLLVGAELGPALLNLDEASQGLRRLVKEQRDRMHLVSHPAPWAECDLNTPERYRQALATWKLRLDPPMRGIDASHSRR